MDGRRGNQHTQAICARELSYAQASDPGPSLCAAGDALAGYSLETMLNPSDAHTPYLHLTFKAIDGDEIHITPNGAVLVPSGLGLAHAIAIKSPDAASGQVRKLFGNPQEAGHFCFRRGPPCLMTRSALHTAFRRAFEADREQRRLSGEPPLANNRFTGSTFAHVAVDAAESTAGPWVGWATSSTNDQAPSVGTNDKEPKELSAVPVAKFECGSTDTTVPLLTAAAGASCTPCSAIPCTIHIMLPHTPDSTPAASESVVILQTYKSKTRGPDNCGGSKYTYSEFMVDSALMDGDTSSAVACHNSDPSSTTGCAADFIAAKLSHPIGNAVNINVYGNGVTATVWWSSDGASWTKSADSVVPSSAGAIVTATSLAPNATWVALCSYHGDFRVNEFQLKSTTLPPFCRPLQQSTTDCSTRTFAPHLTTP